MSPFVVAPQTKKLAVRSQNVAPTATASRNFGSAAFASERISPSIWAASDAMLNPWM